MADASSTRDLFGPSPTLAEEHLTTLEVLRETLNYLQRLPAHPMTAAMARKVAAHLADPGRAMRERFVTEQADALKRDRLRLRGGAYTPAGIPVIEAELCERKLIIRSPHALLGEPMHLPKDFGQKILRRLADGETLELRAKD
jgi:hypothetical protein